MSENFCLIMNTYAGNLQGSFCINKLYCVLGEKKLFFFYHSKDTHNKCQGYFHWLVWSNIHSSSPLMHDQIVLSRALVFLSLAIPTADEWTPVWIM